MKIVIQHSHFHGVTGALVSDGKRVLALTKEELETAIEDYVRAKRTPARPNNIPLCARKSFLRSFLVENEHT